MLAEGKSRREIFEHIENVYQCKNSLITYWYNKAVEGLHNADERFAEKIRAVQRERLEKILYGAIEKKDYGSACKIIETMNKMFGLYETKQSIKIEDSTIRFNFENDVNNEDNENVDE